MTKQEIRQEMRRRAGTLARGGEPERLWERLEASTEFARAQTVLIYMALPDEVPTAGFIERWRSSKNILIPLVSGDRLELKPYSPDALIRGYAGVPEPLKALPTISPDKVDLAIIPGQAFDLECNRLGRGKGFYDRLLPQLRCPKFGVAQNWRIVNSIPCDSWDAPLDAVFTPGRVILPPDRKL